MVRSARCMPTGNDAAERPLGPVSAVALAYPVPQRLRYRSGHAFRFSLVSVREVASVRHQTTVALVSENPELADRIDWWLSREHTVVRALDPAAPLTVYVIDPNDPSEAERVAALLRRAPASAVIVTGECDCAPRWAARLAARDRRIVVLFPAAPVALQVAARALLHRPA